MATYTTNLNLEKPVKEEFYNIDVFNNNMDKIDGAMSGGGSGIEQTIANAILESDKKKYPIGSILFSTTNANPSTYLGFGTWVLWGAGRVPVGVDITDTDFNEPGKMSGNKTHTHTSAAHTHSIDSHTHTTGDFTLTTSHMPSHNHTTESAGGHSHSISSSGDHTHVFQGFIQTASTSSTTWLTVSHKRETSDSAQVPPSMNSSGAHTHSTNSTGAHSHTVNNTGGGSAHNHGATGGTSLTTNSTTPGATGATSTVQPSIACYMWHRIS